MSAKFGPAGNSKSFYDQGNSSSIDMPRWLADMGLDAYEYQCGRGVNIGQTTAAALGQQAERYGIVLSIHAPYYINLASDDAERIEKSIGHILKSARAAKWMGAGRVVIHPGNVADGRKPSLERAKRALAEAWRRCKDEGLDGVHLCPETLGKKNQLGDLSEVMELCLVDDSFIPTIDFGHLNARDMGWIKSIKEYEDILRVIEDKLGHDRLDHMHCHFSRIEYTEGGEKRHWTLDDAQYGPDFEPLAEALCRWDISPIIICESRDVMAEDARKMKDIYISACNKARLNT
ncbi:MAG: deoxyribonuclease [Clostridiales bacterium]|jgi:deoxyribonuclease-4|nr:deoxyribonuclease [Clostridiales bacterium]